MEENCEIFKVKYRLLVALLVLLFVLEILKKKIKNFLNKFFFFFFRFPDPKSEKKFPKINYSVSRT